MREPEGLKGMKPTKPVNSMKPMNSKVTPSPRLSLRQIELVLDSLQYVSGVSSRIALPGDPTTQKLPDWTAADWLDLDFLIEKFQATRASKIRDLENRRESRKRIGTARGG